MRVYEAIAGELHAHGVEAVFGLLGDETVMLGAEVSRLGIAFHRARHEGQAVTMAYGYAQASGRVGVAINSRGPGFTNSLTAMAAAAKARSHVLLIIGDYPTALEGSAEKARADWKYIDQAALCSLAGVRQIRPASAGSAAVATRAALGFADKSGAVALTVPADLMTEQAEPSNVWPTDPVPTGVPDIPRDEIHLVADLLETGWAASRPVILAGKGALNSNAGPILRRLGELTGSLMATTMQARSLFAGDPFAIGVCGASSTSLAAELISRADCLLVFGATLNNDTTYKRTLFPRARVVHVDCDPDALGVFVQPDVAIVGDAAEVAAELVAELGRRGHETVGYRTLEVKTRIGEDDPNAGIRDESSAGRVDPRTLMIELDRLLPKRRTLAFDAGHFMYWSFAYLHVDRPGDFIQPNSNWYSIGLGLGAAIGAAVARPDQTTVLNIGDAGLMMSLGDLDTAIRHRLPILVIVSNDESWGSEVRILQTQGLVDDVARVSCPPFAALAQAMGAEAETIASLPDLRAVQDRLQRVGRGPLVLDCRIKSDVD